MGRFFTIQNIGIRDRGVNLRAVVQDLGVVSFLGSGGLSRGGIQGIRPELEDRSRGQECGRREQCSGLARFRRNPLSAIPGIRSLVTTVAKNWARKEGDSQKELTSACSRTDLRHTSRGTGQSVGYPGNWREMSNPNRAPVSRTSRPWYFTEEFS